MVLEPSATNIWLALLDAGSRLWRRTLFLKQLILSFVRWRDERRAALGSFVPLELLEQATYAGGVTMHRYAIGDV